MQELTVRYVGEPHTVPWPLPSSSGCPPSTTRTCELIVLPGRAARNLQRRASPGERNDLLLRLLSCGFSRPRYRRVHARERCVRERAD